MKGRFVGFPAGAMIETAAAAFGVKLWGYLFAAVFIIAMAASLQGCSDASLNPSLLLGNGSGAATGSGAAPAFGLPGNAPGYVLGIQIRD